MKTYQIVRFDADRSLAPCLPAVSPSREGWCCTEPLPVVGAFEADPDAPGRTGSAVGDTLHEWCVAAGVNAMNVYLALDGDAVVAAEIGGRPWEPFVILYGPDDDAVLCEPDRAIRGARVLWYPNEQAAEAARARYLDQRGLVAAPESAATERAARAITTRHVRIVPTWATWAWQAAHPYPRSVRARVVKGWAVPVDGLASEGNRATRARATRRPGQLPRP